MPSFSLKREKVFGPRRQARPKRVNLLVPAIALVAVAILVWATKDRIAFYSALYEGKRAVDKREFARGREAIERAWSLKPEHPYVLDSAGFLFLSEGAQGWKAKVDENYAHAVARGLRGNPLINHIKEARKFLDSGRYEQAEVELEHSLMLAPHNAQANLLLGHLYYSQARLAKAIDQYQKALAISPKSREANIALAKAQEARNRGSVPYIVDRNGTVLAEQDAVTSMPLYRSDFWLSHVIGYRSSDHGRSGIEESLASRLPGNVVTLSIDSRLQRIADSALGWQKGAVVIIKPSTGEILAAVSHPTFRPGNIDRAWNQLKNNENTPLKNRAFEGLYEPGSIAKIITAAAIIEGKVDVSSVYPMKCRGYLMVGSEVLYDSAAHRTVSSFTQAFDQSCNVAMARMAPMLGTATITQFLRSFGFGEQDRIDLDVPVAQSRAPLEPDSPMALDMACIGLGNDYRITPLHAALLAATVANGGVMMAPILVREVRSVTNSVILSRTPKALRTAIRRDTANQLNALMVDFVKNGLGRKARLLRYTVAGKTGTSGNSKRGLHAWFICFAPAEKPELAMAVLCENGGKGNAVAAPIAQKILSEALR